MMKTRYPSILFVGITFLCLSLIFFGVASAATKAKPKGPKHIVLFAHSETLGHMYHQGALKFKKWVEERSKGRVEVQIFPSAQLGTSVEMVEACQVGATHMVGISTGHMGNFLPEIDIIRVPYLFPGDYYKVAKLMNHTPAGQELTKGLEKINLKNLAWTVSTLVKYTSNKAIRKPEDFKGIKFRTMASPLILETFRILGASPTPIPYMEVYSALQLGLAEGQENPLSSIVDMKFHEVQKYLTHSNHVVGVLPVIANKKWFEKLPADIQKILADAAIEWGDLSPDLCVENEKEMYAWLKKNSKIQMIDLTPEQRQAFMKATKPVRAAYIKLVGARGKEVMDVFEREIATLK
jgi:tripartite ATP-independent transporter DctP family solute receptor